jgi:hypothetical protein
MPVKKTNNFLAGFRGVSGFFCWDFLGVFFIANPAIKR